MLVRTESSQGAWTPLIGSDGARLLGTRGAASARDVPARPVPWWPHRRHVPPGLQPVLPPEGLCRIFLALLITALRWHLSKRPSRAEWINKVQAAHTAPRPAGRGRRAARRGEASLTSGGRECVRRVRPVYRTFKNGRSAVLLLEARTVAILGHQ